nr:VWA domain-containing protein [Candidatus Sigynarchaeota archaeon]
MDPIEEQPDVDYFIHYSPVMTEESRYAFVKTIDAVLSGKIEKPSVVATTAFESELYKQLDTLISNADLLNTCRRFPEIARDVAVRLIKSIIAGIKNDAKSDRFHDEEVKYKEYQQKKQETFLTNYDALDTYLSERYTAKDINLPFYSRAARELREIQENFFPSRKKKESSVPPDKEKTEKQPIEEPLFKDIQTREQYKDKIQGFKQEVLKDWGGLLEKKKQDHLLAEIDKSRELACKELYENIDKFKKMMNILGPFSNELGRLWDLSKGNWNAMGFDILAHFAALLEKQETLQKLAEMLGRLHESEKELEEREIETEKIHYSQKIDHSQKSEIISVHESDDIQYCLPQELVLLSSQESDILFYLKFAEKKLLTYQLINRANIAERRSEKQKAWLPGKKKKGPIIICVDTSGSMHGTPEIVAKTLCFALLRIALLENRQCFLISFSTAIETIELTNFNKSYASMIKFLTHSFYGGTDANPALREALRQIQTERYEKADVLMISDFIMDQVGASEQAGIEAAKKKGTKFHSLVVSSVPNPAVLANFDNSWVYDPNSKSVLTQVAKNFRTSIF